MLTLGQAQEKLVLNIDQYVFNNAYVGHAPFIE